MLGVTERHIKELVAKRRIPFVKVGRLLRFDLRDLEQFIKVNRTAAR